MASDPSLSEPSVGAPPHDTSILAGLEDAVAKARHDISDEPGAGEPGAAGDATAAVDSSAVMDVLRGALDRYSESDHRGDDEWQGPPLASFREAVVHPADMYRRQRRQRMAVIVIGLFLIGGLAFATLGGGKAKVKTTPTLQGQSVTTLARQASTSVSALPLPTTDTTETTVVSHGATPTTHHSTATTTPGTTDTTVPDTTDTTIEETTTTVDTTTTTEETTTTVTVP